MKKSSAFIGLAIMLSACGGNGMMSAPGPGSMPAQNGSALSSRSSAQAAVAASAAPVPLITFPSLVTGGSFGGGPVAYVTFGSSSTVDRTVQITSSNPAVAMPFAATVTIPAGTSQQGVSITTAAVSAITTATITVSGAGIAQSSANVTIYPTGATLPPPIVGTVTTNPLTVAAGTPSTATVNLTSPAPAGGLNLLLFAGPTVSGQIQPTVTVPAGGRSVTVPVTTTPYFPNSTTTVIVQAAAGDSIEHTGLNVVTGATPSVTPRPATPPPATPPPAAPLGAPSPLTPAADSRFAPGTAVAFDWSDVSGAASYTIQVSNSDKFTTFVVNQTVTASAVSSATLPTSTLWWRVRANAASGAAGAWSAASRFELKS